MMNEGINNLSPFLKTPIVEMQYIPEGSIVITSIVDYSSSAIENLDGEILVDDESEDQDHVELQSLRYICQDCGESFNSPDLHRQHELSTHVNIEDENVFHFASNESNEEIRQELDGKYALSSESHIKKKMKICLEKQQYEDPEFYICNDCGKSYKLKSSLRRHLKKCHNSENQCRICQKKFFDNKHLRVHMKSHMKRKFYCCDLCNYRDSRIWGIEEHKNSHLKSKNYNCHHCGRSFGFKRTLKRHLNQYHNLENQCRICQKKFFDNKHLRVHMKSHMKGKFYCCDLCNYQISRIWNVERHKNYHLESKSYICNDCGRKCKSKMSMKKHLILFHKTELLHPNCPKKSAEYKTVDSLKLKKHKSLNLRSKCYTSDHCGISIKSEKSMENHLSLNHNLYIENQISLENHENQHFTFYPATEQLANNDLEDEHHNELQSLECNYQDCVESSNSPVLHQLSPYEDSKVEDVFDFTTVDSKEDIMEELYDQALDDDLDSKIEESNSFTCDDCGQEFKLKMSLEKHWIQSHGSEFQSQISQNQNVDKNDLQVNIKILREEKHEHTDERETKAVDSLKLRMHKRYACEYCDRLFKSKKSLDNHLILFHKSEFQYQMFYDEKDKYYWCDLCEYKTTLPSRLVGHKNKHVEPESDNYYNCYNCNKSFKTDTTLIRHLGFCRT